MSGKGSKPRPFSVSQEQFADNWDKACLDVFEKYPDKKLWISSHRIEPQMFPNSQTRPGTVIVPKDYLGAYWNDFNTEGFEQWAEQFVQLNDFKIPKGEGVSGLIRKKDWDEIGGNDPRFAPADVFPRSPQVTIVPDIVLFGYQLRLVLLGN